MGSSICRFEPNAYRITLPGACVRFRLCYENGRTYLFAQFKSCASSLWQRLKQILGAFLPLRRLRSGAAAPKHNPTPTKRRAQSVAEVVAACQVDQNIQGRLVFTDKAFDLAEACTFRHAQSLEVALRKLAMAVDLMRSRVHLNKPIKDFWEHDVRLPVTLKLSDTQDQKFGRDYDALHDGKVIRGRWHVTLGNGHSPAECMSVHFALCGDCQALIITRCGVHGRTARS